MLSQCPHCKGISWELHTEEPRGSAFKINFIRCAGCKAPVGTMEYYSLSAKLEQIEKEIKSLKSSETTVVSALQVIDQNIRLLFRKQ